MMRGNKILMKFILTTYHHLACTNGNTLFKKLISPKIVMFTIDAGLFKEDSFEIRNTHKRRENVFMRGDCI